MIATFSFKISNSFDEWANFYDNDINEKKDLLASLGIKPMFRASNVDDPNEVILCWETPSREIIEEFLTVNEANIAQSGHIIESTTLKFFQHS